MLQRHLKNRRTFLVNSLIVDGIDIKPRSTVFYRQTIFKVSPLEKNAFAYALTGKLSNYNVKIVDIVDKTLTLSVNDQLKIADKFKTSLVVGIRLSEEEQGVKILINGY